MDPNDIEGASAPPTADTLELQLTVAPKINLALQQNSVPIARELLIRNGTETDYKCLALTVESEPSFVSPREWRIDRLNAKHTVSVTELKIDLAPTFLQTLQEATSGHIKFLLRSGGEVLAEERREIRLLARNEWGGINDLPERLS